jgi:hypothetical protein
MIYFLNIIHLAQNTLTNYYVKKFVSDLHQVSRFLRVLRFTQHQ